MTRSSKPQVYLSHFGIINNNYSPKWRWIVVDNCFSIYHTSWITCGPKRRFICDNIPTKAILFFCGCSEVNSTWLITSELANQRRLKVLFTWVVYTKVYCLEGKGNTFFYFFFLVDYLHMKYKTLTMYYWNSRQNMHSEKSESQMGFEATTLRDLVGCSTTELLGTLWWARVKLG